MICAIFFCYMAGVHMLWRLMCALSIDCISNCNLLLCVCVRVNFFYWHFRLCSARCATISLVGVCALVSYLHWTVCACDSLRSILCICWLNSTVPTRYCFVLCSFLRYFYLLQITFERRKKKEQKNPENRIAFVHKRKMPWVLWTHGIFVLVCAIFCSFVCFTFSCNWRRQTFEFPRWLHVYIASIDWNEQEREREQMR